MKTRRNIGPRGVIARCRRGERLCKQHACKRITYFLEPSGRTVPPRAADLAMRSGTLVPSGGDLLENDWQVWTAKEGS